MFKVNRKLLLFIITMGICFIFSIVIYDALGAENQLSYEAPFDQLSSTYLMQEEEQDDHNYVIDMNAYPNYEPVANTNNYRLYLDQTTHNIGVEVKETGYVWFSSDPAYDGIDSITGRSHNNQTKNRIRSSIYYRTTQIDTISGDRYLLNEAREVSYQMTSNGFVMKINLLNPKITFDVVVELDDQGLTYYIPFESITEQDIRLQSIRVFPGFGMTTGDPVKGYMFIPEGSGALIRFNTPVTGSAYNASFYDADYGYLTLNQERQLGSGVRPSESVRHPVIGMVHGTKTNGYLAYIESGAEAAQVRAEAKSNVTKYFSNSIGFQYRQLYFRPTNNTGSGYRITSPDMAPIEARVKIHFLTSDDADYVGMAKKYREIISNHMDNHQTNFNQIPLHVDFIGSDVRQAIFSKQSVVMTRYDEALRIVKALEDDGINHLSVSFMGKETDGSHAFQPTRTLGGKRNFDQLAQYLDDQGYPFYLQNEINFSYHTTTGIAKQVGGNIINLLTESSIFTNNYLLDHQTIDSNHQAILNQLSKTTANIDFNQTVTLSYTHIDTKRQLHHRNEMIKQINGYLQTLKDLDIEIAMRNPNHYAYPYASEILDTPVSVSGYGYITEGVPFVQIALSGLIHMYSKPLNYVANRDVYLLRLIEYGIYPSYVLTEADAFLLKQTDHLSNYASEYRRWASEINQEYHYLNDALKHVYQQNITDHIYHGQGLVEVIYDNGVTLVINYDQSPQTLHGQEVPGLGYLVIGGA